MSYGVLNRKRDLHIACVVLHDDPPENEVQNIFF